MINFLKGLFANENLTSTISIQRTSSGITTRKLNRNSSESFCCINTFDKDRPYSFRRKSCQQEDETKSRSSSNTTTETNDLDEYALNMNECTSIVRRSNPIRFSRKLALNRIIAHNQSNLDNSSTNLSHQNLMEASYLLDFLNKGLEQSRELPRSNMNAVSSVELNNLLSIETTRKDSTPIPITIQASPNSSLKRHSSVGCLQSKTKQTVKELDKNDNCSDKHSQETICYQGMNSNSNLDSIYYNENENKVDSISSRVTLRRSSSTSECDLTCNIKVNYRNRREIASAVLHEETNNGNNEAIADVNESTGLQSREQSKSSSRLSGLKKLGTLYKTFEDDDFNVTRLKRNTINNSNQNFK
jgi:hypothetical protein